MISLQTAPPLHEKLLTPYDTAVLSDSISCGTVERARGCLNAPYGANLGGLLENVACNLASTPSRLEAASLRCRGFRRSLKRELRELHAEFSGARCFLTARHRPVLALGVTVLMHLVALGAF